MAEFVSRSGAKISINHASFEAAQKLWSTIQRAAADLNLSFDYLNQPESLSNLLLRVDSSEAFREALWPCLIRCTRNDKKIEKSTFNDKEVRKEYYEIIAPCVEENVGPFFAGLLSELSSRMNNIAKTPISESDPQSS